MNPWHDISLGDNAPEVVNAVIEIPNGSKAKYEIDKDSGLLILDRVLYSSVVYPANYGMIPRTLCDDKDPLDILVLSQVDMHPMCLVEARVVGMMRMIDEDEADDKIIAVAANDMSVTHIKELEDLPPHFMDELRTFFEDYKKLEKKKVAIEEFEGRDVALDIVRESIEMYKEQFGK